jgi:hypothetical protein
VDNALAGEWAMAYDALSAGAAPPWIESDKEARAPLAAIEALIERAPRVSRLSRARERATGARLVADANRRSNG